MNRLSPNFSMEEFDSNTEDTVGSWLEMMLDERFQDAADLCDSFIEKYRAGFQERALKIESNEYNDLLVVLVFIKGLFDYVQLCKLTSSESWYNNKDYIESAWIKLCDCRERLVFSSQSCRGEAIDLVFRSLSKLEEFYLHTFGAGNYVSPGIEFEGGLCSICNVDFRACSHVPGGLYEGAICTCRPINPSFNHLALVDTPKDPRCRIWSWNLQENPDKSVTTMMPILFAFSVDDFLRDSSTPSSI